MRYGEAVHTIDLPSFTGNRTLTIKAESLRSDGMSGCNELYLQSTREFVHSIIHSEVVKLGLCIITFFFGVLPIPVLMFYSSITKNPKNKAVIAAVIAAVLNTLTTLILVCCGAVDYAELLIVSHIIIFVGVILLLYLVIRVIVRKEMSRSKTIYFTSALIVLAASGMFDMIRYYVNRSRDFTFVTLIGLLVYAVILAIYEYKHIIEMQVRSSEAELMQALAMADTLTGLGSRAAFVAAEKELRKRTSGKVLFVHFDVNFLKKVNDEYGHAEGDRHLKATAKVLSDSFAEFGKVYRVGGDEFLAILDGGDLTARYQQGITKLEQAQLSITRHSLRPCPCR